MRAYLEILERVLTEGSVTPQRAKTKDGKDLKMHVLPGQVFSHDLGKGFPLLTTKFVDLKKVAAELEMFIKGVTRKEFLHERGTHIWDEWTAPNQPDPNELGPVYGAQWRRWRSLKEIELGAGEYRVDGKSYVFTAIDQLGELIYKLLTNPYDRRTVVTAWNPADNDKVALPACHMIWQTVVTKDRAGDHVLNLCLTMRSADLMLGVPYNVASYGLLLLLLAKHVEMKPGTLTVMLNNCHVYENHLDGAREQLARLPKILPEVIIHEQTGRGFNLFDWTYKDFTLLGYQSDPAIKLKVAV